MIRIKALNEQHVPTKKTAASSLFSNYTLVIILSTLDEES